ncbi:MAG: hypothetical protein V3V28_02715 [Polaribacter sp.]|uniref:hypothetical protein n=1 Tax=Polaribacter sp. TaxID=1920175 RepID=UPI002F352B37
MNQKKTALILVVGTLIGFTIIILLFLLSEDMIHRQRDVFIRRYPHHPANKENALDLGYKTYYIAGVGDGKIYLGNKMAPAHLIEVDTTLTDTTHIKIRLDETDLPFQHPQVRVNPPNFYVFDGQVPCVFKGNTEDWKGSLMMKDEAYFSFAEPIDTTSVVFRARSSKAKEKILGKFSVSDSVQVSLTADLLQKQIDGIFCTDGKLLFGKELNKLIYVYFYRNQFIVADTDLKLDYVGKTIDTISKAQIKVAAIDSEKSTTSTSGALVVNKHSCVYNNYLFINSNMLGKYEDENMLKQASIIDVYDLTKNTYEFSFYLYNYKTKKTRSFQVYGNLLIAMADNYIVTHKLRPDQFKGMKIAKEATFKLTMK